MRPPHQQSAATTPALRGPTRSSQPPQMAAEVPSSTKNSVYIQPRSNWVQSQLVVNSALPVMSELAAEGGGIARADDRLAGARRNAERAAERQPEHAEAIGHADAEMDGKRRRRNEPAIIAWRRDDALLVQETDLLVRVRRTIHARHGVSLPHGALGASDVLVGGNLYGLEFGRKALAKRNCKGASNTSHGRPRRRRLEWICDSAVTARGAGCRGAQLRS